MKFFITILTAVFLTTPVLAEPIEMLVGGKKGGSYFKLVRAIQKDIVQETVVVDLENCNRAVEYFNSTDKPTLMMWSQATNIVEGCEVDLDKYFVGELFGTTWALCGPAGSTLEQFTANTDKKLGVVGYIKHIVDGLDARAIPYANTNEIKQALLAGDVDWGFTTLQKGMSAQAAGEMTCVAGTHTDETDMPQMSKLLPNYKYATLKLDFYMLAKNVNNARDIIDTVIGSGATTKKVVTKGMMYTDRSGRDSELHAVKENEKLWK